MSVSSFPPEAIQPFFEHNWNTFVEYRGPVYDKVVRQFYASFGFDDHTDLITFTIGITVYTMSLETFGIHLGVPTAGERFYSIGQHLRGLPEFVPKDEAIHLICTDPATIDNKIHSTDLKHPHDLRYKIIDWNIYCREGNHNEVPASLVALMWSLHNKVQVNMAYFVAKRMSGLPSNGKRALPYSMLLNNIFASLELDLENPRHPDHRPLDSLTLTRMGKQPSRSSFKRARDHVGEEEERIYMAEASGSGAAESPEAELSGEDPDDTFYNLSTESKLSVLYRQQRRVVREQKGIKKLLKDILNAVTCNRR